MFTISEAHPEIIRKIRPVQHAEDLIELKFKELLFNIFSDPRNKSLGAYVSSLRNRRISIVKQVMGTNHIFHMSVSESARMAQCSVSTFKRNFQKHYHAYAGRMLKQQRLEHVRIGFKTDGRSVSKTANKISTGNVSHFSCIFKQTYGTASNHFNGRQGKTHRAHTVNPQKTIS